MSLVIQIYLPVSEIPKQLRLAQSMMGKGLYVTMESIIGNVDWWDCKKINMVNTKMHQYVNNILPVHY